MPRPGRPRNEKKKFVDSTLRILKPQLKIVDRAAEIDAEKLGVPLSRNSFMVRTLVAASRKVITDAGESIPGEL
jgi:uncharacterized protein (DUF1778 family)